MNSNKVQFIFENKLIELENPDPNQTILNFIRDKLKKNWNQRGMRRRRMWCLHNSIRRIRKQKNKIQGN